MEKKYNILILSGSNPYKIAGIVALNFYYGFKREGHNVRLLSRGYGYCDEDVIGLDSWIKVILLKIKNKFKKKYSKAFNPKFLFLVKNPLKSFYSFNRINKELKVKPDFVILVFTHKFISPSLINKIYYKYNVPIFWQIVDMEPFTGGCHYAWSCKGYVNGCFNCPAIKNEKKRDFPELVQKKKISLYKNIDMQIVVGSDWLMDKAKESLVLKDKIFHKSYLSVDSSVFKPIAVDLKKSLRKKYGVDEGVTVISFGASAIWDERKGIQYILDAINILEQSRVANINVLVAGVNSNQLLERIPYKTIDMGLLSREELPLLYQLSDVFLSASLQDTGPYMLVEALMCSCPVVAFNEGFANEFVVNEETGFLVEEINSINFAEGIKKIIELGKDKYLKLSENCSVRTTELLSEKKMIDNYINFFVENDSNKDN